MNLSFLRWWHSYFLACCGCLLTMQTNSMMPKENYNIIIIEKFQVASDPESSWFYNFSFLLLDAWSCIYDVRSRTRYLYSIVEPSKNNNPWMVKFKNGSTRKIILLFPKMHSLPKGSIIYVIVTHTLTKVPNHPWKFHQEEIQHFHHRPVTRFSCWIL